MLYRPKELILKIKNSIKQDAFNLRPSTTRDQMRAFSYACHFRSRDKDGGHTIRSAIAKTPTLHANFMSLCLTKVIVDRSFTLRE